MHSAQCRPRTNEAPSGVQYVSGGAVIKNPAPPTDVLSDLDLILEIVPVTHRISTRVVWLRMNCEGRRLTEPQVLALLYNLACLEVVDFDDRLGWSKAGE